MLNTTKKLRPALIAFLCAGLVLSPIPRASATAVADYGPLLVLIVILISAGSAGGSSPRVENCDKSTRDSGPGCPRRKSRRQQHRRVPGHGRPGHLGHDKGPPLAEALHRLNGFRRPDGRATATVPRATGRVVDTSGAALTTGAMVCRGGGGGSP